MFKSFKLKLHYIDLQKNCWILFKFIYFFEAMYCKNICCHNFLIIYIYIYIFLLYVLYAAREDIWFDLEQRSFKKLDAEHTVRHAQ